MKYTLLLIALLLTTPFSHADETTKALQIQCYPHSGHVTARLIDYYGCGDGHCTEDGFSETAEGKYLKQNNIILILSKGESYEPICTIGKSKIQFDIKYTSPYSCDNGVTFNIEHNNTIVAKHMRLYDDCFTFTSSKELTYKAFYKGAEPMPKNTTLGFVSLKRKTEKDLLIPVSHYIKTQEKLPITPSDLTPEYNRMYNLTMDRLKEE